MTQATILLVDDSADDKLLTCRAMTKAEIVNPVHTVTDGVEAVEYLTHCGPFNDRYRFPTPLLVLLDLKMPRMNGFELLTWIRQQPQLKRMWVIVLSHSQELSDINRAYELGANSYLVKPTRLTTLVDTLRGLKNYWLTVCERPDAALRCR
jgi:CheY-like chemotaxis protein